MSPGKSFEWGVPIDSNRVVLKTTICSLLTLAILVVKTVGLTEEPTGAITRLDGGAVLALLGAKMEQGLTKEQLSSYNRVFAFMDLDRDGRHSKVEFIDRGRYLTPFARRGIFNAADADQDGFVTRAEYLLNRIITDEAKSILQAMDDNDDGIIQRDEFLRCTFPTVEDPELARSAFKALDTNRDGELTTPEYLRVWGRWARTGKLSAEERITALEARLGE